MKAGTNLANSLGDGQDCTGTGSRKWGNKKPFRTAWANLPAIIMVARWFGRFGESSKVILNRSNERMSVLDSKQRPEPAPVMAMSTGSGPTISMAEFIIAG